MKNLMIVIASLVLTGCQRGCIAFDRSLQISERDYTIVMFSGGDTVFVDKFRGIVNNSEYSDGVYYYKDGRLVEVSGDYIIISK